MSEEETKIDKTLLLTLLLLYFGACGGLWHVAFWSTFKINYIQYIGLSDIIKNFAAPFITSAGISIVTYFFTNISGFLKNINNPEALVYGKGSHTKVGKFLNKWQMIFGILYTCGIIAILIFDNYLKYSYLPLLIATPIGVFLTNKGLFAKHVINPDLRNGIITFLILIPVISVCFAKRESLAIYENHAYQIVTDAQLNQNNDLTTTKQLIGLKYIGSSKDIIFLSKIDNSELTFVFTKDLISISYGQFKKRNN